MDAAATRGYASAARASATHVIPRAVSDSVYQRSVPGLRDAVPPSATHGAGSAFGGGGDGGGDGDALYYGSGSGAAEAYYDGARPPPGHASRPPPQVRARDAQRQYETTGVPSAAVGPSYDQSTLQAAYESGATAATDAAALQTAAAAAERAERVAAARRTLKQRVTDIERAVNTGNTAEARLHRAELERLDAMRTDVRTTQWLLAGTFALALLALVASVTSGAVIYTTLRPPKKQRSL